MSIDEKELRRQVTRLRALPRDESGRPWGTAEEPGVGAELLRVLWRIAENDDHAKRIVDELMDTCQMCPAPAEVTKIGMTVESRAAKKTTCPECGGTQFVISWWLVTYSRRAGTTKRVSSERLADESAACNLRAKVGENQTVLSAAEPCVCHAPPRQNDEPPSRRRKRIA